eukprot:scaffold33599_cov157-Skeletonema_dohrnii-CCMP3373.AAC.2
MSIDGSMSVSIGHIDTIRNCSVMRIFRDAAGRADLLNQLSGNYSIPIPPEQTKISFEKELQPLSLVECLLFFRQYPSAIATYLAKSTIHLWLQYRVAILRMLNGNYA